MYSNDIGGKKIIQSRSVEVLLAFLVAIVPEAIPLRTDLGVKLKGVIIDCSGRLVLNGLLKCCSPETRPGHEVQWQVGGDANA